MTEEPLAALRHALAAPVPRPEADARDLPATPGSYLLLARLNAPLMLSGRFAGRALPAGWLVYAGSARGPGGLKARLARHLRREKRIRWHIDQLTTRADALVALPFADAPGAPAPTECALIARLLECGLFAPPMNGFGSSDCRACPAHLLAWRPQA